MSSNTKSVLEQLLEAIDTEKAQFMLADLRDPAKRTPQLYNAVEKLLERHKFTIAKLSPDLTVLGDLGMALDEFNALSDEEGEGYTSH